MSVLRYYGLYNLCIRVRVTPLYCNILVYPFVFSVALWYSHRGTLISAVYPACMITVHGLILGASHWRRRKNRITSLHQEEGVFNEEKDIIEYITKFYKNLFGQSDCNTITLQMERTVGVSNRDIEKLTEPFTEKEVKEVVFNMAHNKSPGPDGFNAEFYQHFWEVIK